MGNTSSSEENQCSRLSESTVYSLIRNYIVINHMIKDLNKIIATDEGYDSMMTLPHQFLVDSRSMLKHISNIPDDISDRFAEQEEIVVGVTSSGATSKVVTFYDTYNNIFLVEQRNFVDRDTTLDRLENVSSNLKTRLETILDIIDGMCSPEVQIIKTKPN